MTVSVTDSMSTEKALDYAKLSDLAYAEWKNGVLVSGQKGYNHYDELWTDLYNKGYRFDAQYPNDPQTGYSGTIFQKDGKKILANRGTDKKISLKLI